MSDAIRTFQRIRAVEAAKSGASVKENTLEKGYGAMDGSGKGVGRAGGGRRNRNTNPCPSGGPGYGDGEGRGKGTARKSWDALKEKLSQEKKKKKEKAVKSRALREFLAKAKQVWVSGSGKRRGYYRTETREAKEDEHYSYSSGIKKEAVDLAIRSVERARSGSLSQDLKARAAKAATVALTQERTKIASLPKAARPNRGTVQTRITAAVLRALDHKNFRRFIDMSGEAQLVSKDAPVGSVEKTYQEKIQKEKGK